MVSAKEVLSRMKVDGWNLSEECIEELLEGNNLTLSQAQQEILNTDIKEVGAPCLPDLQKGKGNAIPIPLVLQVSKVRNVSAPKAFEESGTAPRLLKVSMTDGSTTVHGLEVQNIKLISLKTAPGTKVQLSGKIVINSGFLLLNPHNITVIGGTVEELYEKWKLSSSVSKYNRIVRSTDGSGPPPWVPFGKRIEKNNVEDIRHFKALKDTNSKDKSEDEFESQRKQAVRELAKEGQGKIFGGGKQMLDSNVQKVINAGFTQDVAEWALRHNKNDPSKAIKELRAASGNQSASNESSYNSRNEDEMYGGQRGRGGRGRGKGRGRGRGIAGPDGSDDDYEPPPNMPRPSGPASLFDFFDSKIIEKKENVKFVEAVPDVRGPTYQRGRGRGARGRREDKNTSPSSAVNGTTSPPNLTAEHWPAPGEEKAPLSNRTYLESKEMMDEKEHQESFSRPPPRMTPSSGRVYQPPAYRNGYNDQQGYCRDDVDSRGGRQNYGSSQRDYNYSDGGGRGADRGGRRGARGGGGYGGGNSYNYCGSYKGEADVNNYQYSDSRGAQGGGYGGNRREGGGYNSNSYRGDYINSSNSSYRSGDGSGYRNDSGSGYRGNTGRNEYNQYENRYNYYSNNRGRGGRAQMDGVGNRAMQGRSAREAELINDFKNSMTVSGHYQNLAESMGVSGSRYNEGSDYKFSGTLEFHRGGGRRGGGRGGYK
ncbi:tudor domain-containing protein 3 [Halocaridina rubra]|uniref:Tudor domain-containing protein 3 n=1 Tax=Halocaridina rubra TaxID=373956 RepID=A0AAN8XCI3_HALRR